MNVEIGKIVNTHGIKGEVKVMSESDFTDERFQPGQHVTVKHSKEEQTFVIALIILPFLPIILPMSSS